MKKRTLEQVLQSLTLEEKASLLTGRDFWRTRAVPAKGVPSLRMADGPHGVRREAPWDEKKNGGRSLPATCYPTAATLACSWDEALCAEVGRALAQESAAQDVQVLLGPGVNIKRSPLCGRNFEYYSEDPLLAGKLGAAWIRGLQSGGVGASLKHYAANNQESWRMRASSEIDERALREIYLKPFEIAVKEGRPATVMASYNRLGGTKVTEHTGLLRDILRREWGFEGLVVSDWGALNDRVAAVRAGLDLEMPASGGETARQVVAAVRSGALREEAVDECCRRVLRLVFRYAKKAPAAPDAHWRRWRELALRAALESAVLMKNEDGALPLAKGENVAVIGALARRPRYQGSGSSLVNARGVSFLDALRAEGVRVRYSAGYRLADPRPDEALERAALACAAQADTVLCFLGLTEIFESEGYDRPHMRLPQNQTRLLRLLAKRGKKIVVVLCGGAPVEMPWAGCARAVLYAGLGGEQGGPALVQLLWGRANPCGKLAETWPLAAGDVPCAHCWPMGPRTATYNESIYVGYRYYDKAGRDVRFAFGHGLSYTRFAYEGLVCEPLADGAVRVRFTLRNEGARAGAEVAQVYVQKCGSAVHRAVRTLAGFARVELAAGESRCVELRIARENFAVWDVSAHAFAVEQGAYRVSVGASSRDLRLSAPLTLAGDALHPDFAHSADGPYGAFCDNAFPQAWFCALSGCAPASNGPLAPGQYTMETTLGEMRASPLARRLEQLAVRVTMHVLKFSPNPAVNRRVAATAVRDLPFKNLAYNLRGFVTFAQLEKLLALCNRPPRQKGGRAGG